MITEEYLEQCDGDDYTEILRLLEEWIEDGEL